MNAQIRQMEEHRAVWVLWETGRMTAIRTIVSKAVVADSGHKWEHWH